MAEKANIRSQTFWFPGPWAGEMRLTEKAEFDMREVARQFREEPRALVRIESGEKDHRGPFALSDVSWTHRPGIREKEQLPRLETISVFELGRQKRRLRCDKQWPIQPRRL